MSLVTYKANGIQAVSDHILIKNMEFNERLTTGGIIMQSDNGKSEGIRPRWGEVLAVGPKQKDVKVGEWILVKHGRWTRGLKVQVEDEEIDLRRVDPNDILAVSDEQQTDETWSTAMVAHSDRHRIEGSLHNDGTDRDSIAK